MEITHKIWKTGNSLVVTVPVKFLKENNLKIGDHFQIVKLTKVEFKPVGQSVRQKCRTKCRTNKNLLRGGVKI